jgi:hypothetical protein
MEARATSGDAEVAVIRGRRRAEQEAGRRLWWTMGLRTRHRAATTMVGSPAIGDETCRARRISPRSTDEDGPYSISARGLLEVSCNATTN